MELRNIIDSLSRTQLATAKKLLLAKEHEYLSADSNEYAINNYACPHCGHRKFYKNGKVRENQRFKCHGCSKTFGIRTNTLFHGTRKPISVWSRYIDCLFEQKSVRKIAEELDLAASTAFFWRHKVLESLKAVIRHKKPVMKGIVESDETYFPLSFKGQKTPLPRPAKKRGTPASKRGISK